MTILGGTAIDLELTGDANGAIIGASNTAKLFVTLGEMISGPFLIVITIMCLVLIDVSGHVCGLWHLGHEHNHVGGDQDIGNKHKVVWGLILTAVVGVLLIVGQNNSGSDPMEARRCTAMGCAKKDAQ